MQKLLRRLVVPALALAGMALAPAAASAGIVCFEKNGLFQGGLHLAGIEAENDLFNKKSSDIRRPPSTVRARQNPPRDDRHQRVVHPERNPYGLRQSHRRLRGNPRRHPRGDHRVNLNRSEVVAVNIAETETLVAEGGQAQVEGEDGSNSNAAITAIDPTFDIPSLSFQIDAEESRGGDFTRSLKDEFEVTETYTIDASPGTFSGPIGINEQFIEGAAITITGDSIADLGQIGVAAGGIGVTAVPEASSLALMGVVVSAAVARVLFRRARMIVA